MTGGLEQTWSSVQKLYSGETAETAKVVVLAIPAISATRCCDRPIAVSQKSQQPSELLFHHFFIRHLSLFAEMEQRNDYREVLYFTISLYRLFRSIGSLYGPPPHVQSGLTIGSNSSTATFLFHRHLLPKIIDAQLR